MRDFFHSITSKGLLSPRSVREALEGREIDLLGHDAVTVSLSINETELVLSDDLKLTIALEHRNTPDADFEAVPTQAIQSKSEVNGNVLLTLDAQDKASQVYTFGYIGDRRYLRLTIQTAGDLGDGISMNADALCCYPHMPQQ